MPGDLSDVAAVVGEAVEVIKAAVDKLSILENRIVRMLKELQVTASNTDGKVATIMGDLDDLKQSLLNITHEEEIQEQIDDTTGKIKEATEELKEGR